MMEVTEDLRSRWEDVYMDVRGWREVGGWKEGKKKYLKN